MKLKDILYGIGGTIALLGMSGIAEAITGRGMIEAGIIATIVGFSMCLIGYVGFYK